MNKPRNLFLFLIALICTVASCSHSIKIDVITQSLELNHCEIAFGTDLNTLSHENEILLQIGTIDTTNEQAPIPVAIVVIEKKEIILKQVNHSDLKNETSKTYEGEGYKLILSYKKEITEHNESIYKGKFLIENKNSKSEYDVVGSICNL